MINSANNLQLLESRIDYSFKDKSLLERALTHASTRTSQRRVTREAPEVRQDNEQLEFLGDRVLGLTIAQWLIEIEPAAEEGRLARRFNALVRRETCAAVAREMGLGEQLILSASEQEQGGRDKDNILADACEGLLGAVFTDGGFEPSRAVIRKFWESVIANLPPTSVDPKSALQEWAQGAGFDLPAYVEQERTGPDHAPEFVTAVTVGKKAPAIGTGQSKRAAEQSAATAMLVREKVWNENDV